MNDLETAAGGTPGLPRPAGVPGLGHLPRWTSDPLRLLEEGAALGPAFDLRLWRGVTVGYTPEWNRAVLGDLDTFHSKGSLSQLSPYLSAGVVSQDNPGHRERRAELNPTFHRRAVTTAFGTDFGDLVGEALPVGEFDAGAWASTVVLAMLARAFFGSTFAPGVLESYVAPLDSPMPGPLLRRPFRIRKMNTALESVFAAPEKGSLAELFATLDGGVEEARVVIAAAYDTTAHSLAFALWELAARPDLNDCRRHPAGRRGDAAAVSLGVDRQPDLHRRHRDRGRAGARRPDGPLQPVPDPPQPGPLAGRHRVPARTLRRTETGLGLHPVRRR